jgi:uncharacterized protein YukE
VVSRVSDGKPVSGISDLKAERDRLTERVAELVSEGNQLREERDQLRSLASSLSRKWQGDAYATNQGTGYANGLRDCARELGDAQRERAGTSEAAT